MKAFAKRVWKTGTVLLGCAILVWAQPARQKIAVLEIKTTMSQSKSAACTEKVLDELFKMDLFIIVEQSEVQKVMATIGLTQSGCASKMCAIEAGELLGVRKVIFGTVEGETAKFKISLKMVDVQTGEVVR
jgi:TolB-like protein